MKAITAPRPGGPEQLELVDLPNPEPGPGELLVHVHATAVNRADVLQRRGRYPPPPGASDVLGLEMAGVIAALGDGVAGWSVGDEVCALLPGGGYAEQAVVPAEVAMPLPPSLDLVEAAAVPEAFTTAWDNLFNRGRLASGGTVLLHGGASGVGTAAIQLARRRGCEVLVTAGSPRKLAFCTELGAKGGIDYRECQDFDVRVGELTGGRGVDVVLDIIGGGYLARNLRCLAVEGRLVIIGLMGGASAEVDLGLMLTRRLTITASTLRARSVEAKATLARQLVAEVWPGFADGSLRPVIDRVLPLEKAAQAHAAMEASEHIGKIVLTV
ncbi:MAG: NAD(P)H-quinone oxidoreductase [Egibacteraceae bacterium]